MRSNESGKFDRTVKLIFIVAAIIAILTGIQNLFTGYPFNEFLTVSKHNIIEISDNDEFRIESIKDKFGKTIDPGGKFSYKFGIPLTVYGTTQIEPTVKVWVLLQDIYGGYYLQNPPVSIHERSWTATNIRPLKEIKYIRFIQVDEKGDEFFQRKVNREEWGKFSDLPLNSKEVGFIQLE